MASKKKASDFDTFLAKKMKSKKFRKAFDAERQRLEIAYRIIELREKQELTQQKLAKASGLTQSAVARIESGQENLTIDTLYKIADVFDKRVAIC